MAERTRESRTNIPGTAGSNKGVTWIKVPQRLTSPPEETPGKNHMIVSMTTSNLVLNWSIVGLLTTSAGNLFQYEAIL